MATTTINPSSYTYVSNQSKTTDHSGSAKLYTTSYFANRVISDANWASASSYPLEIAAALLRFSRPSVLRYARITSAYLTWVLDSDRDPEGATAYVASYTTSNALSGITWNNVREAGVFGTFTQVATGSQINVPATRSINVTSLFNADLGEDFLTIAIAAGGFADAGSHPGYVVPSGCYITVTYESGTQPAPTPLYPRDQTLIEADSTMFSWQFNSETAATQIAVQLEYKNVNDGNYTVLNLTQTAQSYTLNTTLTAGSYQWRLKATNDASVTSGYSEVAYFNIVGRPAVPIINTPDNKALTEITWNTSGQQSFEIILADQSGNELLHETLATAEASYKPNIFLKGQYLVSIRVMNNSMMWSDWGQRGFTISAAGPSAATIKILSQEGIPAVRIGYTLPADTSAALMRKQGDETKILANLNPNLYEYIDDTVSSETVYKYFIRTYVNGYTDTTELEAFANFDGAIFQIENEFLHLKTSDETYLPHSEEISAPYALNEFSGRNYYVIERGETINLEISRRFFVEKDQKKLLDKMSLAESVYYRDNKGNAFRAAILKTSYDAHMGDGYLATIRIVRLNEEEVEVNV